MIDAELELYKNDARKIKSNEELYKRNLEMVLIGRFELPTSPLPRVRSTN